MGRARRAADADHLWRFGLYMNLSGRFGRSFLVHATRVVGLDDELFSRLTFTAGIVGPTLCTRSFGISVRGVGELSLSPQSINLEDRKTKMSV